MYQEFGDRCEAWGVEAHAIGTKKSLGAAVVIAGVFSTMIVDWGRLERDGNCRNVPGDQPNLCTLTQSSCEGWRGTEPKP